MTCCANCRLFRETAPYKLALSRTTANLCAECLASLSALGMTWIERRADEVTPIVERRQPAWLSRITAKELRESA